MTNSDVAKKAKVTPRTLYNWYRGTRMAVADVEQLAELLGLGVADVALELPAERVILDPTTDLTAGERRIHSSVVATMMIRHSGRFTHYIRHVGLMFWPLHGFVRRLKHAARNRHFYAAVRVRPKVPATAEEPVEITFSCGLGQVRFDFGVVKFDGKKVQLEAVFALDDESVDTSSSGVIEIWLWFGADPCSFLVRANADFDFELLDQPADRDPDNRPAGVVCFRMTPAQRAEMERDCAEPSR